ncbi:hypothetical protein DJ522_01170 [Sulfolobus sp. F3]|nr:hypothetical protein DJ522_01170 [Sulfolobus sp. F3]
MKRKAKTLAELIINIRIARNKVRSLMNGIKGKIEMYNNSSLVNVSRFPHLSKMLLRESEILEKVLNYLVTIDVMLELLEIKVETIIYIGYIVNDAPAVVEAIKSLKDEIGSLPEISILLDGIYEDFFESIDVPKDIKIRNKEDAKGVIEEAKKIAELKEKREIYYEVNT